MIFMPPKFVGTTDTKFPNLWASRDSKTTSLNFQLDPIL
jgi:hypothetical protein